MSLSSKKEYPGRVHGRYQRAGREHKGRILDEFCAVCAYHRKFALRLLNRPLKRRRRKADPKRLGAAVEGTPGKLPIHRPAGHEPAGAFLHRALALKSRAVRFL